MYISILKYTLRLPQKLADFFFDDDSLCMYACMCIYANTPVYIYIKMLWNHNYSGQTVKYCLKQTSACVRFQYSPSFMWKLKNFNWYNIRKSCFILFCLTAHLNASHFLGLPKYHVLKSTGSISDLLKFFVWVFLFSFAFTNPFDLITRFIYSALK